MKIPNLAFPPSLLNYGDWGLGKGVNSDDCVIMLLLALRILIAPDWDYHPLLVVIGKRNIPGESVGYSAQRSKKISFCTSLLGKSSDTRLKNKERKKKTSRIKLPLQLIPGPSKKEKELTLH